MFSIEKPIPVVRSVSEGIGSAERYRGAIEPIQIGTNLDSPAICKRCSALFNIRASFRMVMIDHQA